MRDIGKNIRNIRQSKRITQDELAEKLYVTRQTVSNYETGKSHPDIEMLLKIAEILNVSLDDVLYGKAMNNTKREHVKRMILSGTIAMMIFALFFALQSPLKKLVSATYNVIPLLLLKTFALPLSFVFFGYMLCELAIVIFNIKIKWYKWQGFFRIALFAILGVIAVFLLLAILLMQYDSFFVEVFNNRLSSFLIFNMEKYSYWFLLVGIAFSLTNNKKAA